MQICQIPHVIFENMSVFLQTSHQSSVPSNIIPLYFFSSNIIYFGQRSPLKSNFFRFSSASVKIYQIPHVNLKWQVNFSSNFESFFIFITHNYSINFKPINFLFWTKGSRQSPSFECSGENLPNSSCYFSNHKSVVLQILHHSSVSWNITPLYFVSSNIIYFGHKERIKTQIF